MIIISTVELLVGIFWKWTWRQGCSTAVVLLNKNSARWVSNYDLSQWAAKNLFSWSCIYVIYIIYMIFWENALVHVKGFKNDAQKMYYFSLPHLCFIQFSSYLLHYTVQRIGVNRDSQNKLNNKSEQNFLTDLLCKMSLHISKACSCCCRAWTLLKSWRLVIF